MSDIESTVVGADEISFIVKTDFGNGKIMFSRLTDCCMASAKGSMDEYGNGLTVCRACYAEIDPIMGDAWGSIEELRQRVPVSAEWSL